MRLSVTGVSAAASVGPNVRSVARSPCIIVTAELRESLESPEFVKIVLESLGGAKRTECLFGVAETVMPVAVDTPKSSVGLSAVQRKSLGARLGDSVTVSKMVPRESAEEEKWSSVVVEVEVEVWKRSAASGEFHKDVSTSHQIDEGEAVRAFCKHSKLHFGRSLLSQGSKFLLKSVSKETLWVGSVVCIKAEPATPDVPEGADAAAGGAAASAPTPPQLVSLPAILFDEETCDMQLLSTVHKVVRGSEEVHHKRRILSSFDMEDLGIGGLDSAFESVFRRAFLPRMLSADQRKMLGMKRCPAGVLLYGPPGTGKTLIARQIGKILQCREPKIVNGPEIMNKYVGESEKAVRDLFKEAKEDFDRNGEDADLHLIIFDELDAIGKSRGGGGGGAGEEAGSKVVTQLLTMMDGYEAIGNVIVVGMTNRIDVLDAALLRSGRFQVQQEIGLPEEDGRKQILRIHMREMISSGTLAKNVDVDEYAALTPFFTGAELEEVVQNAGTFALSRCTVDGQVQMTHTTGMVQHRDFLRSIAEKTPQFIGDSEKYRVPLSSIVLFNQQLERFGEQLPMLFKKVLRNGGQGGIVFLLQGQRRSGKSTLANVIATASNFSCVRRIKDRPRMERVLDEMDGKPSGVIIIDDYDLLCADDHSFHNWAVLRIAQAQDHVLFIVTVSGDDFHQGRMSPSVVLNLPSVERADEYARVIRGLRMRERDAVAVPGGGGADGTATSVAAADGAAAADDADADKKPEPVPMFPDEAVVARLAQFCQSHGSTGAGTVVAAALEAEGLYSDADLGEDQALDKLFESAFRGQAITGSELGADAF